MSSSLNLTLPVVLGFVFAGAVGSPLARDEMTVPCPGVTIKAPAYMNNLCADDPEACAAMMSSPLYLEEAKKAMEKGAAMCAKNPSRPVVIKISDEAFTPKR